MNSALDVIIRDLIEREGPLSVAQYMQLALQHPQHGYYVSGDPLGVSGDFTTAPEISQIFGEMIGLWCADMWRRSGRVQAFVMLELGPGRGTLMRDALRATAHIDGFHQAMQLVLVESNVALRVMQQEKLAAFHTTYCEDFTKLPSLPLFVIANEFFDALPIHQYVKLDQGWRERQVGCLGLGEELAFVTSPDPILLPLPENVSFYEISLQSITIVQQLAAHIKQYGGGGLFMDYGYTQPSGADTLQAVCCHESVSPLKRAGDVDLTAHVDFLALKVAAEKQGCCVPDVIGQGTFLKAMGADFRADQLKLKATDSQREQIDAAVERLMDPAQMGVLFKAMAIVPQEDEEVCGFL